MLDKNIRQDLLLTLKKEVKQLMEISVTCKFIQEDNSCINSFCGNSKKFILI